MSVSESIISEIARRPLTGNDLRNLMYEAGFPTVSAMARTFEKPEPTLYRLLRFGSKPLPCDAKLYLLALTGCKIIRELAAREQEAKQ